MAFEGKGFSVIAKLRNPGSGWSFSFFASLERILASSFPLTVYVLRIKEFVYALLRKEKLNMEQISALRRDRISPLPLTVI